MGANLAKEVAKELFGEATIGMWLCTFRSHELNIEATITKSEIKLEIFIFSLPLLKQFTQHRCDFVQIASHQTSSQVHNTSTQISRRSSVVY